MIIIGIDEFKSWEANQKQNMELLLLQIIVKITSHLDINHVIQVS